MFLDDFIDKIKNFPSVLHGIKNLGIFRGFKAAAVPEGDEINALSMVNPRYPLPEALMLAYEKRVNELQGICPTLGHPLYEPLTFFTDLFDEYKRVTPSVSGKRAEQVLAALSTGALNEPQQQQRPINIGGDTKLEPAPTEKIH